MNVRKFVEHFCHNTLLHVRMAVQESFTRLTFFDISIVHAGGGWWWGRGRGEGAAYDRVLSNSRRTVCVCVCVCA